MLCSFIPPPLPPPHASVEPRLKKRDDLVGHGDGELLPLSSSSSSSSSCRTRRSYVVALMGSIPLITLRSGSSLASQTDFDYPPKTELIQKLLEKSRANKAKNEQERLDSYYERNFKDYFEFVEGTIRNKSDLTENEKGILAWLERARNKKK